MPPIIKTRFENSYFRFLQKYPEHKKLHRDLAKFDDHEKMIESNAFEMAAMGIFNTIDFVMENSEKVDAALKNLKIVGNTHKKIPGFQVSYFKVSILSLLLGRIRPCSFTQTKKVRKARNSIFSRRGFRGGAPGARPPVRPYM